MPFNIRSSGSYYAIFDDSGLSANRTYTLPNASGALLTTNSTASLAVSASYATTASYALNGGGGGASITSPGDNRIITSDGTTSGLIAESNITFTGNELLLTGSLQMTGSITMNTGSINNPVIKGYYETMVSKSISSDFAGGIVQIDLSLGNVWKIVLDGNIMNVSISKNPTTLQAGNFTIVLVGNGSAYSVNWGSAINWPGGSPGVVSGSGNIDVYTFTTFNSGTDYIGYVVTQNGSGLV